MPSDSTAENSSPSPYHYAHISAVSGSDVFHLNAIQEARPLMDQELRVRLQTELAPEIGGLGSLLGKDLTSWYRG